MNLIEAAKQAHADEVIRQAQQDLERRQRAKHEAIILMYEVVRAYLMNGDSGHLPEPVFESYDNSIAYQLDAYFTLDELHFKAVRWEEGTSLQLLTKPGQKYGHDVASLADLGRLILEHNLDRQPAPPDDDRLLTLDDILCKACGPGHLKHTGVCGVISERQDGVVFAYLVSCSCHPDGLGVTG